MFVWSRRTRAHAHAQARTTLCFFFFKRLSLWLGLRQVETARARHTSVLCVFFDARLLLAHLMLLPVQCHSQRKHTQHTLCAQSTCFCSFCKTSRRCAQRARSTHLSHTCLSLRHLPTPFAHHFAFTQASNTLAQRARQLAHPQAKPQDAMQRKHSYTKPLYKTHL